MFLEHAMQLLTAIQSKQTLDDADFGLKQALSSYIEMQIRAATKLLEIQLTAEGFTDDDLKGYSPSSV